MEEATNSVVPTEGTQVSEVATETAVSTESTPQGTNDDVDWNDAALYKDIPEEKKELARLYGEKVFKRAYTKKTQSIAEERRSLEDRFKALEVEKENLLRSKTELEYVTKDILEDPTRTEMYRNKFGMQPKQVANKFDIETLDPDNIPADFTVGDMIRMVKDFKTQVTKQATKSASEVVNRTTADQSYTLALKSARKDPEFEKNEPFIVYLAQTDADIARLYNPSAYNEYDVLMAAKDKYMKHIKTQQVVAEEVIKTLETKKQAGTIPPQRPIQVTNNQATVGTGGIDPDDILASVKARRPDLF